LIEARVEDIVSRRATAVVAALALETSITRVEKI
jgi:hypothetical protein